ncbi:ESX secretion-associated protein EspG [Amycolatopsis suaedae]|uniref:ESX secretion-associated protein EspG n=1 Tax=Amycolatopsis suaedae TaxID=2510978 RepID=A0A4Q7J6D1_9PSEU|nr:ESX secretion-associated protein EspG [Amycolatopsis suaedae]RZQ61863.1 ESX secretion-associated protein EspG [Amycolatopsis suaedae]
MAFDFLWEAMRLGEVPYPLRVRSHGATEEERVHLRQRTNTELKARGVRDEYGRLEPHIEDWLTVLGRPTLSVDALHIPDFQAPPVAVLAATDGRTAVVAVQDNDGIWVRPTYPESLVSTVVDLLPPGSRGTEASIVLPLQDAMRTQPKRHAVPSAPAEPEGGRGRRAGRGRSALSERAADPREAYAVLAGQPRIRGGQLAVNSRNSVGGKQRSPVLAWFDTATGRYLSLSRPGRDGSEWVTVAPADTKTLRSRLGELAASLSAA